MLGLVNQNPTATTRSVANARSARELVAKAGRLKHNIFTLVDQLSSDGHLGLQWHIHHDKPGWLRIHFDRPRLVLQVKPAPGNRTFLDQNSFQGDLARSLARA